MKSLITSELQILVRGEMSVRCSPRRCGSPVHVDVATDGFFAWSYGEDISVTALKRRESACMFYDTALLEKLIHLDFSACGPSARPARAGKDLGGSW